MDKVTKPHMMDNRAKVFDKRFVFMTMLTCSAFITEAGPNINISSEDISETNWLRGSSDPSPA